jgi:hypothetical protein
MRKGKHEMQPKRSRYQPKVGTVLGSKDHLQARPLDVGDRCETPTTNFTTASTIKPMEQWWAEVCGSELRFSWQHEEGRLVPVTRVLFLERSRAAPGNSAMLVLQAL